MTPPAPRPSVLPVSDLLTELEAADHLRVSLRVLRRERYAGRLGSVKVGMRVFIPAEEIGAYLARQTRPAMLPPIPGEDECRDQTPAQGLPARAIGPSGTSSIPSPAARADILRGRLIARRQRAS